MSDALTLTPPKTGGPPPTLEGRALFRVKAAALSDAPSPPPEDPAVVLIAQEGGGTIAMLPDPKIVVLAHVRPGARVNFYEK